MTKINYTFSANSSMSLRICTPSFLVQKKLRKDYQDTENYKNLYANLEKSDQKGL